MFPRSLNTYGDEGLGTIVEIILHRAAVEPFNVFATTIFFLAIIHSFLTGWFTKQAHKIEAKHDQGENLHIGAGILHFMGEIEAVFGIWAIVLGFGVSYFYSWETFVNYVGGARYVEPIFVVVIMTIASSRPILKLFELIMWKVVKIFKGTLEAWWFAILTFGPILGSFITGPAAMVVSAHLLADKFYDLKPSNKLKYSTLALLFVNISIGGTLSNFASPPVLMVAGIWKWDNIFMMSHFGFKAILAILLSNTLYLIWFKKDFNALKAAYTANQFRKYVQRRFISKKELEGIFDEIEESINRKLGFTNAFFETSEVIKNEIKEEAYKSLSPEEIETYSIESSLNEKFNKIKEDEMRRTIPGLLPEHMKPIYRDPNWDTREDKVPSWVMGVHILFMIWTLMNAHEPVLFVAGFLFFLGFFQITAFYQNRIDLKPALMVAFFLSGLVVHGGLQGWWISPVLGNLQDLQLFTMSTLLTSFNDNAAITYLSSLVPNLTDSMKYAVVAGAVTGGGLTIIANSPNPVGQSILKKYFENGISALYLFEYALIPTLIASALFMLIK